MNSHLNWHTVKLIASRELRDQLRDRRTLFVIAILPLLLYPLLGMAMLQITQFLKEHASIVWVVGPMPRDLAQPLMVDGRLRSDLFGSEREAELLQLHDPPADLPRGGDALASYVRRELDAGRVDAVLVLPDAWNPREMVSNGAGELGPQIYSHQAKDRSRIAAGRLTAVLSRWRSEFVDDLLESRQVPRKIFEPFVIGQQDISEKTHRHAALWSKFLPFVLIIWALTGAFYPAIDLCAGEKERGTLETLLSSPARREEIVWGKLFTVMIFSMGTSALNLICMVFTGFFVMQRIASLGGATAMTQIGSPPLSVMFWMLFALPPLAALFSALAIALAAMARSTKEGQYYLIPLMVGSMPLMMLPVLPSVELDLGTSLIPLTGVVLLLRSLIEGEYLLALKFFLPVSAVTALGCWMSIRWAVSQFNDEDVLFREGEQFSLRLWLVHLVRDRRTTPTVAGAFMAATLMMIARFFSMFVMKSPENWTDFVWIALASQLMILGPVIILAMLVTRSLQRTFLVQWTSPVTIVAAALLAVVIHPLATSVGVWLQMIYPLSEQARAHASALSGIFRQSPGFLELVLLLALIPAICEELAFRGFILSGMRHIGHRWLAILLTSIFFGLAHPILQQSINALLLGLVIGYVAVQSGSILPCIAFHFVHNSLQFARLHLMQWTHERQLDWLFWSDKIELNAGAEQITYGWPWVGMSLVLTVILVRWFRDLPASPTAEERLQLSVDQSSQVPATTS